MNLESDDIREYLAPMKLVANAVAEDTELHQITAKIYAGFVVALESNGFSRDEAIRLAASGSIPGIGSAGK